MPTYSNRTFPPDLFRDLDDQARLEVLEKLGPPTSPLIERVEVNGRSILPIGGVYPKEVLEIIVVERFMELLQEHGVPMEPPTDSVH